MAAITRTSAHVSVLACYANRILQRSALVFHQAQRWLPTLMVRSSPAEQLAEVYERWSANCGASASAAYWASHAKAIREAGSATRNS